MPVRTMDDDRPTQLRKRAEQFRKEGEAAMLSAHRLMAEAERIELDAAGRKQPIEDLVHEGASE